MSARHQVVAVEPFDGTDELINALQILMDAVPGDEIASVESDGFALMGWAALVKMPGSEGEDDLYTIDLCDKEPALA